MSWTAEEDAAFRAATDHESGRNGRDPEDPPAAIAVTLAGSSWLPVDLGPIVAGVQAGEIVGPVPALMRRTDGACLLYPGEVHSLAGEPESGKGWITLDSAKDEIANGSNVLYLDFEDAPASIVTRLLALGATRDAIVSHFFYVRPSEPFTTGTLHGLLDGRSYRLAVIDGVSEAFVLLGLDPSDNLDVAKFLATVPRPMADRGTAVLQLDHVAKAKESRGRYALGAQHKLAGIATAYSTDIIKSPSRTDSGLIKLKVEKDRHGHVRGHAQAGVIALVHITPTEDGDQVTVTLEAPEASYTPTGDFRPTNLMEKVSKYLEDEPGASANSIRRGVSGKAEYIDQALRILVAEAFVSRQQDGQARRHYNVQEYRETDDRVPASRPRPDRVPDAGVPHRVPASPPLQGTRTRDTVTSQKQTINRVPGHTPS